MTDFTTLVQLGPLTVSIRGLNVGQVIEVKTVVGEYRTEDEQYHALMDSLRRAMTNPRLAENVTVKSGVHTLTEMRAPAAGQEG